MLPPRRGQRKKRTGQFTLGHMHNRVRYTIFQGPDLNGGSGNALSTKWLRRQSYVVDGIWTEVFQEVSVDGGWYGHVYTAALYGVVVVQLVWYDVVRHAGWVVPTQLNGTRRRRNALQVAGLSRNCNSGNVQQTILAGSGWSGGGSVV